MARPDQIRDRAGNALGILPLGQALQDKDRVRIEAAYSEVYSALSHESLADWGIDAEVPAKLVPHIVALVADNCLNDYGVSGERYKRIKLDASVAMRNIRQLQQAGYASDDDPEDF